MESIDLRGIGERFITATGVDRQPALEALIRELKEAVSQGRLQEAAAGIRSALVPDLDYSSAQALVRALRLLQNAEGREGERYRVGVLGGYNTSTLVPLLELYLFGAGFRVEVYESPYGVFRQEIRDADSPLYSFKPRMIFLATGWRDISSLPAAGDDAETIRGRLECEKSAWARLWEVVHSRLGCTIIQNSFDPPPWRVLGNHDSRDPSGWSSYLSRLNLAIQDQAPPHVIIHDVGPLAAQWGLASWGDPRFYHYAKLPCAPSYLPDYAHSVASLVSAQGGRSRKCLVLDLDNTLWGGVIGEDGVDRIRVGPGDPEGEAFAAFQHYVKDLHHRGILLAVCSKNDESKAREAFLKHPGMVLHLSDFSAFVANWRDKASNILAIARELNIGLDSLVFVDDEPTERAQVRRALAEVAVPEMPVDPSDYIRMLEAGRLFQLVSLAREDLQRPEYYRANAARSEAATAAESVEEFLRSLDMTARVETITPHTMERSAQLINKSNQFNLTARRYSVADVRSLMERSDCVTLTVTLTDRFGDNGLVSVLIARVESDVLCIDTWVMSCRVLKRSVEHFLLNALCDEAEKRGLQEIQGEYIPTGRNELVREHYREMGFRRTHGALDGCTRWMLSLDARRLPLPTFVRERKCP